MMWSVRTLAKMVLCLGMILGASCTESADWILQDADLISASTGSWQKQGIAIREGRIVALGSADELAAWRGSLTREVSLAGKAILPGLVDHHVHLLNVGAALLNRETAESLFLDLYAVTSFDQLSGLIARRAALQPEGTWILGQGWSQATLGTNSLPGLEPISLPAPRHPVFLTRVDGHAGWANAEALRIAGIEASTPDPPGGKILRDSEGRPTGVLLETANELIVRHLPPVSTEILEHCFDRAVAAMASLGVTEVFDAGFLRLPGIVSLEMDQEPVLEALMHLDEAHALPIRVHLMIPAPGSLWSKVMAEPAVYRSLSPRLSVSHVKLFADGAMGSRGAALSHPFSDDPTSRGVFRLSESELFERSREALEAGFDVAIHAIGDAAVTRALDVYEQILRPGTQIHPGRLRIEHFSYASDDDFRRAARLGVGLSVQPNFIAPDNTGTTMEDLRIGHPASSRVYAFGRLNSLGARMVFGTDYFSTPSAPLLNFFCAVTRQNELGLPPDGWNPHERLPRAEALRLFLSRLEAGGRLEVADLTGGSDATFSIVSANPLRVEAGGLLEVRVHATFRNGQPVYQDGELSLFN